MSAAPGATSAAQDGAAIVFTRVWCARAPLARVLEATRLERTPELHPLITRFEATRASGVATEGWLRELVPLGPLRIPNKYRASRTLLAASEAHANIVLEAWAAFGVHLRHELALRAVGVRTEVTHVVRVDAPRLLRGFVARTAQRAHDAWVARVVAWAEAEPAREG
jgi:hypothetical protein